MYENMVAYCSFKERVGVGAYTRVDGEYHAVASYKNYYQSKNDKIKMEWRHTEKPTWFVN